MKTVSQYQPLKHFQWGRGCDGWNLVDEPSLSVKQEQMPPGTSEDRHFHNTAQQFFFILSGRATFEVEEERIEVSAGEGLQIAPGKIHRISNQTTEVLTFLLCSQPSTSNDRINCTE